MEFKKLKINTLIPASYNPRKKLKPGDAEYEKIKNSITEFGYVDSMKQMGIERVIELRQQALDRYNDRK